jgi:uncharacterized membrane protein YbhN (UPF0104 family)
MTNDLAGAARAEANRNQLARLCTLSDVVYGVGLVLIIQWLPLPSESEAEGKVAILELFAEFSQNIITVLIGLAFVIVYWMRSNTLLGALDRTSKAHTALSIASVFFVLLLLYSLRVSEEVTAPSRRVSQSFATAMIGIAAGMAWYWARRKGLVLSGITPAEQERLQIEAHAEPLAAVVTIPLAFAGELWWNLGWLAYFPIAAFLRRRERRRA